MASVSYDIVATASRRRWVPTGIPERFWGEGFDSRSYAAAIAQEQQVHRWVAEMPARQSRDGEGLPEDPEGFGVGLLLCGNPGTGKTTLACAALTTVKLKYGKRVFFTRWSSYLDARRMLNSLEFDRYDPETAAAVFSETQAVEETFLVALDDVGHEHSSGSGYGERLLDELLRGRFDRGLPTIITTNLTSFEWAARYDATMRSFMRQACPPVIFEGSDLRVNPLAQ